MKKWFFFSDMQMPLHDEKAVELAFKVMNWFKPDVVVNIGDLVDGTGTSRWSDGSTEEVFASILGENVHAQEYWQRVRKLRPKARLIWTLGNHDIRPFEYVDKKAPALRELITYDSLWDASNLKLEIYDYNKPPLVKMGDIYIHHGVAVSKHSGDSARSDVDSWGVSIVRGHCFSEDTEILTESGWKYYSDVNIGTMVMTMSGEYQAVSDKFIYDDYDKLISIKNRNVDALVTPDHEMIYLDGGVQKTTAKELVDRKRTQIPLAVTTNQHDASISDHEIRLAAWVMAEGNFDKYSTKSGDRYRIRLSQSDAPDGRLERLTKLIEDCGLNHNWIKRYDAGSTEHGTYRNFDAYRTSLTGKESKFIFDLIDPETKKPKGDLLKLSARQAQQFLMEYVWADGSKNSSAKNSYQLATNNIYIRDYLQELAAKSGWRSSYVPRPDSMYCITFNTRGTTTLSQSSFSEVDYSGVVWCVTVPDHSLVLRRNGKTFVAGNSHRMGSYHKTYELRDEILSGYEIGHLMDVDKAEYTQVHNWQQGFAVGYEDEGVGSIDLIKILPGYVCYYGGKKFTL